MLFYTVFIRRVFIGAALTGLASLRQLALGLTFLGLGGAAAAYPDMPPLGHSGGFGEPDCSVCHEQWDGDGAEKQGLVRLVGVPKSPSPEERYALSVILEHPGLATAGFQLTVRRCDGDNDAGSFVDLDERTSIAPPWVKTPAYAWQTLEGSKPQSKNSAHWMLFWFAPESVAGGFAFAVAANAGNGDQSPFEDRLYTGQEKTDSCVEPPANDP